ncbi:hypothetical protein HME9302_00435 [Alteripontixanthobacter maritimus]|uniref:TonB C-terminal domain-containing protein n=1 Tax=Alteripontixanthobacter maritimus TaxID=2161824 RepID=A0A369QAE1_9SPHN|nr:energy transducer TonB [Alteripontixanthobacter maritimus]RDC59248.1 hypothetical protein HME9302_00435 [Alteripontixanthobacter maritimus]
MIGRKAGAAMVAVSMGFSGCSTSDQSEAYIVPPKPIEMSEWARDIQMNYPAAALLAEEQGVVRMQVDLGIGGRVTECRVTGSSGSATLDRAACAGMLRFARFEPARNEQGAPVVYSLGQSIRYVLPD